MAGVTSPRMLHKLTLSMWLLFVTVIIDSVITFIYQSIKRIMGFVFIH